MSDSQSEKSKVFIASSGKAKKLAEALKFFVKDNQIYTKLWSVDSFHNGRSTLADLITAAKEYDFAAVLLTKDDAIIQAKTATSKILDVPRDNCIFELGLFVGALGLNPQRCFMVSSVSKDALPSDLDGYTHFSIAQPKDLENWQDCKDAIEPIYIDLLDRIRGLRRYIRPVVPYLSLEELIVRESGGELSKDSEVIVQAERPHETNYRYAQIVRANMDRGIKYHYFFGQDRSGADEIINLIRTLAVVSLDIKSEDWDQMPDRERLAIVSIGKNEDAIRKDLKKLQGPLNIHVLPYKVSEAFCIHSIRKEKSVLDRCYLRWDDTHFLEMQDPGGAKIKYEAYVLFRHHRRNNFFGDSKLLKIDPVAKKLRLRGLIQQKFPPRLSKEVMRISFGH